MPPALACSGDVVADQFTPALALGTGAGLLPFHLGWPSARVNHDLPEGRPPGEPRAQAVAPHEGVHRGGCMDEDAERVAEEPENSVLHWHGRSDPPRIPGIDESVETAGAQRGEADQRLQDMIAADHPVEGDDVVRLDPRRHLHEVAVVIDNPVGVPQPGHLCPRGIKVRG